MLMHRYAKKAAMVCFIGATLGWVNYASAGVVIGSTRVIYRESKDEVTVKLTNNNSSPVLVQSWIDKGEKNISPEKLTVPFILTPPINRMDPGKGQTLRISYIGTPALPTDKESVYWLNVLEVPAKQKGVQDKSRLNIAFRTRIKIFYRPEGLSGNANAAPKDLVWKIRDGALQVMNPTPYNVNLGIIYYKDNGKNHQIEGDMVISGGTQTYKFKDTVKVSNLSMLSYTAINDYGAFVKYNANDH